MHSIFSVATTPPTAQYNPTLKVEIMDTFVPMLLDTGAHVLVLPKSVAAEIVTLPSERLGNRHVKVFGGQEVTV